MRNLLIFFFTYSFLDYSYEKYKVFFMILKFKSFSFKRLLNPITQSLKGTLRKSLD